MKLLLHTCCAPCTIYPLKVLRGQNHQVTGYFYNPNIHPYREFARRKATLEEYAEKAELKVLFNSAYDLEEFLSQTRPWGPDRCRVCYRMRLTTAAQEARAHSFEAFTTTLLYSRYQKHDWIREVGEEIGRRYRDPFLLPGFPARLVRGGQRVQSPGPLPPALLRLRLQRKRTVSSIGRATLD